MFTFHEFYFWVKKKSRLYETEEGVNMHVIRKARMNEWLLFPVSNVK